MTTWVRFDGADGPGFGTLIGDAIAVFDGDMFGISTPTGETLSLAETVLLAPCTPSKIIALWNNSKSAAEKQGLEQPEDPLFFLKGPNTYLAPGGVIRKPESYDGRVIYEAELGIVIGQTCKDADETEAAASIFGYTCVNDVTALQVLDADPSFPQWARAKGYDTFGPFGPAIATDIDIESATIRAELNGRERQNYPVSDLFLQPAELVSRLSVMCWAMYLVMLKRGRINVAPLTLLFVLTAAGAAWLVPAYGVELALGIKMEWTWLTLASLGYVTVFSTIIAWACVNYGTFKLGPNRASAFMCLHPVFGAILGAIFFSEVFRAYHGIGTALVLIGVFMVSRAYAPPPAVKPA